MKIESLAEQYFTILNEVCSHSEISENKELLLPIFGSGYDSQIFFDEPQEDGSTIGKRIYNINAYYLWIKSKPKNILLGIKSWHQPPELHHKQENIHIEISEQINNLVKRAFDKVGGNSGYLNTWNIKFEESERVLPIYREVLKKFQPEGKVIVSFPILGSYSRGYNRKSDYYGWSELLNSKLQKNKFKYKIPSL